jgi:hypothetical protein
MTHAKSQRTRLVLHLSTLIIVVCSLIQNAESMTSRHRKYITRHSNTSSCRPREQRYFNTFRPTFLLRRAFQDTNAIKIYSLQRVKSTLSLLIEDSWAITDPS